MGEGRVPEGGGLQQLLDALPFSAVLLDGNRRVVAANQAAIANLKLDGHATAGSGRPPLVHGRPVGHAMGSRTSPQA